MNFKSALKAVPRHLPHGTASRSLTGTLIDKGERYGAALGFGFIKGYYREKQTFRGIGADAIVGGAALLSSLVLNISSNGNSHLADHLERIGDAGVSSYLNSIGASLGAQKSGRSTLVLDARKGQPNALPKKDEALGAIPPAMGGAYLTAEEVARFAGRR